MSLIEDPQECGNAMSSATVLSNKTGPHHRGTVTEVVFWSRTTASDQALAPI
jgi:hypothetical protein